MLIDANIPPQESDRQLIEFLASRQRPHIVVATKSDRMSGNELSQAMRKLGQEYPDAPMIAFSAKTGSGKDELWKRITESAAGFAGT